MRGPGPPSPLCTFVLLCPFSSYLFPFGVYTYLSRSTSFSTLPLRTFIVRTTHWHNGEEGLGPSKGKTPLNRTSVRLRTHTPNDTMCGFKLHSPPDSPPRAHRTRFTCDRPFTIRHQISGVCCFGRCSNGTHHGSRTRPFRRPACTACRNRAAARGHPHTP